MLRGFRGNDFPCLLCVNKDTSLAGERILGTWTSITWIGLRGRKGYFPLSLTSLRFKDDNEYFVARIDTLRNETQYIP